MKTEFKKLKRKKNNLDGSKEGAKQGKKSVYSETEEWLLD